MMFANLPPASSDLSGAISILNIITDPDKAKGYLEEINKQSLGIQAQMKDLNDAKADLQTKEQELKDKVDALEETHQALSLREQTAKEKEDTLNRVQSSVSKRESDVIAKEKEAANVEVRNKTLADALIQQKSSLDASEADLRNKHIKVDETQKTIDARLAKIQSVLQP